MSVSLITLGREGIISDPAKKIDWLMCCFFFSKHSQTTMMLGKVISLTKIIQNNTDNPVTLKAALQEQLSRFLSVAFVRVQVDVQTSNMEDEGEGSGGLSVSLDVIVSDEESGDGGSISVGYALTYQSTVLKEILEKHTGRNLLETNSWG